MALDLKEQLTQIKDDELVVWVETLSEENPEATAEDIFSDLTLINRLLVIQRSKHLMNRKRGLKVQIDAVIGNHLGFATPNLNITRKSKNG